MLYEELKQQLQLDCRGTCREMNSASDTNDDLTLRSRRLSSWELLTLHVTMKSTEDHAEKLVDPGASGLSCSSCQEGVKELQTCRRGRTN